MKLLHAIAALAVLAAPAAQAQPWGDRPGLGGRGDHDAAREGVRQGRQMPLSRVLQMIAQRTPGHHINTTQGEFSGRLAYFVQWAMPDGRLVIFIVDAESGGILARQGG